MLAGIVARTVARGANSYDGASRPVRAREGGGLAADMVTQDETERSRLSRRQMVYGGIALATLVPLAACGSDGPNLPPIPDAASNVYYLGAGDQIRIITFGEQQLTGEFRVDAGGDIALPLIGAVHAAGRTPAQLEVAVANALKAANLYRNPSVSVEVINYRPIFILGEVTKPGQYAYQPGMTVVTAVAIGGGFTYRAVKDDFSIVRTTEKGTTEGRATRQTLLQPGDVITVYERII